MRNEQVELIVKLREGDPAAFRALYRETRGMLYQYALYKLNGNQEAAEDAVADAYVDAIDHAKGLSLNHNLNAWLYRIAHAKIVDYVRRQARRGQWIRRAGPLVEAGRGKEGPEEIVFKEEDKRLVRAAYFRLDRTTRELLRRKYHERASVREIALQDGKTEKAIESLLYRAKKEFGEILARIGEEKIHLSVEKEGAWESLFQIIF